MQVHKITCLWTLKQKNSKKKFECKLAELQMFGGEKKISKEKFECKFAEL
jgi:hypothetical protein